MTRLKDQMSAAVEALKEKNEELISQQKVNQSMIDEQNDQLKSYNSMVAAYEEKLVEKGEKSDNKKL